MILAHESSDTPSVSASIQPLLFLEFPSSSSARLGACMKKIGSEGFQLGVLHLFFFFRKKLSSIVKIEIQSLLFYIKQHLFEKASQKI